MDDLFFEDSPDPSLLKEMDRGTISSIDKKSFLAELKAKDHEYVPYFERVGPGLGNLSIELKRHVDQVVLPGVLEVLPQLTTDRFTKAFSDVRVYPQSRPMDQWEATNQWNGEILDVLVSFVLAVPADDSLDSMTRLSLLGLFQKDHWDSEVRKVSKKSGLYEKLNVDSMVAVINDLYFDDFHPSLFGGMTLEILFDGCTARRFNLLKKQALGLEIHPHRQTATTQKSPTLKSITIKNAPTQVPVLIALLAGQLGVRRIDPKALRPTDNLYALMGFDDKLTRSLVGSIMIHFDVIHVLGATKMVTVGNAIEFAQETLESRLQA